MAPSRSAARISLAAALLLLAFAPVAEAASKGSDGRPNVVVIMSDDQDFRSMGAMPKVRRLIAARGTTFATSISSYPLCCPARATYYTGRYAHNHGSWTELQLGGRRRVIASAAVMFPIAFTAGNVEERTLHPDDIAGASDIYPDGDYRSGTGSIKRPGDENGEGILGAHVVAWNQRTGALVSGFSLGSDGAFVVAGLSPGPHVLRVEPIDDADVTSFFSEEADIDIDFRAAFHDRLAVAPRGGGSERVELRVAPK